MTNRQRIKKFFAILDEVDAYARCLGKMEFDLQCCAPEEGMDQAGEDMATVGKQIFRLTHSKRYTDLLLALHEDPEGLTELEKKSVDFHYDVYLKEKNVSPKFSYGLDMAHGKAYGEWLKAKKNGSFAEYKSAFENVLKYERENVLLRDEKKPTPYDWMLDDFEKGGSIAQLDEFFGAIKERFIPLIRRIQAEGKPIRTDFLTRPCSIAKQEEFSRYLLELEGLRKSALVLMTTEHPFTDNYGPHDVRVTTHYYEENFISNIFSTLHEGGHALFMQYEPEEFVPTHNYNHMSCAMHETISRFYENIIGRSEEFISFVYPKLRDLTGDTFADISEKELYEAVNVAEPGLIRMEADELTYCLHIIIRYELEKAFVNGEITADEIPGLWNRKYKEYLGVDVPDDAMGCLQDVHWTNGFGYFPSYALGNAYGAQILRTMEKDFDVFAAVKAGELYRLRDWMKEHVFSIASVSTPDEWIRAITGESLNVNYYLDYLTDKFTTLYALTNN